MLQIGSIVDGKYKILSEIGHGGMSVVYLAINERANKTWAIKEVRKDGTQDFTTVKQGLIAETNILKSLDHKYLPSIIDVIDDQESFLIVMDYIEGKSLNKVLKESMEQEGLPIALEDVLSWGKQLCDVFYYLHTRPNPIIYRDMKPANVMLKPDGDVCLIDFGTARVFKTGNSEDTTCLGTPGYAAPEQYGGNGQSRPQSDIYCLGATLHHLITGRNPASTPFNFPKITQVRPTLLDETPKELRDEVLGLEMIIEKCTQYNVEDRYTSCAELKYDLEHPADLGLPHRKKLKRKISLFLIAAILAILCAAAAVVFKISENSATKKGYDYYLSTADVTAGQSEKIDYYKKAIELEPGEPEPYLRVLSSLRNDEGHFTTEDGAAIDQILKQKNPNKKEINEIYLQANQAGYLQFAYEMGLAFWSSDGSGQNVAVAGSWFKKVADANLDNVDFGDNNINKEKWQTRAKIFYTICDGQNKLASGGDVNGDSQYSYRDYWGNLMTLLQDQDISTKDNATTELQLYNEIVYQININCVEFKSEGISHSDMNTALNEIDSRVGNMNVEGETSAEKLKADIQANALPDARKMVESVFRLDENSNASKVGEGGSK